LSDQDEDDDDEFSSEDIDDDEDRVAVNPDLPQADIAELGTPAINSN